MTGEYDVLPLREENTGLFQAHLLPFPPCFLAISDTGLLDQGTSGLRVCAGELPLQLPSSSVWRRLLSLSLMQIELFSHSMYSWCYVNRYYVVTCEFNLYCSPSEDKPINITLLPMKNLTTGRWTDYSFWSLTGSLSQGCCKALLSAFRLYCLFCACLGGRGGVQPGFHASPCNPVPIDQELILKVSGIFMGYIKRMVVGTEQERFP